MRRSHVLTGVLASSVVLAPIAADAAVSIVVDLTAPRKSISPLIYGANEGQMGSWNRQTLTRLGGNRWTAYNWETNASNAGSDWQHQNDNYLSNSNTPGQAVKPTVQNAGNGGYAAIVTIPMAGYVAADKNGGGDVNQTPDYLNVRFHQSYPKKPTPLALNPNTSDKAVYQDEFVHWIENSARVNAQQQIMYSLDNEPDLWADTHARIHPNPVTYQELRDRTIAYSKAIKDVKADAKVLGAVNYGWSGYRTLQGAPDAGGRDFHQYFLAEMKNAEQADGRRLLDALDVHYYSEARDTNNHRVTDDYTDSAAVATRVQAARSLYDPNYVERSWITRDTLGNTAIKLLPRMQDDINTYYPGTKVAITEYNFGGNAHISGGIAQAEALGAFGREGVWAATIWRVGDAEPVYAAAAFDMYLNYNGAGGQFGDTSMPAETSNLSQSAVFASVDSTNPSRVILVAINRTNSPLAGNFDLANLGASRILGGKVYQLTSAQAAPVFAGNLIPSDMDSFQWTMPAMSVNTIELTLAMPEPASASLLMMGTVLTMGRRGRDE